jgi:ComF family protein
VSSLRAPFAYEGAARAAVLTLKFRSGRYLAPLMGELLCDALARRPVQAEVVVPVPLAPGRLRQRGFNQAALLAEHVRTRLGATLVGDALTRQERPPQSTLSAPDRRFNLEGAFARSGTTALDGKSILLIDDVVTTGATVSACAATLAEAGARRISVLAFARDL